VTELFIIGTRIFGGILEDVGRAGGETTVCEDAHLDVARVDHWEQRKATGPEFWSGFGEGGRGDGGWGGGEVGSASQRQCRA
jgi:hypothetical protein